MKLKDKIAVVTGGANGIGAALARRFHAEGAAHVVVADIDEVPLQLVAEEIGGTARTCNVASADDITSLVSEVWDDIGPIDLFCSNAGVSSFGGADTPVDEWYRIWDINVMAHVHAAKALIPRMVDNGGGYLLNTASAAGLLTQLFSAPYSVTKHGAVAFAEWLSIHHAHEGITVSVLCPQGVRTNMTAGLGDSGSMVGLDGMLEPDAVADCVIDGLAAEQFLILPHPEVATYVGHKASDYDRWLRGMRRLHDQFLPES